MGDFPGGFVNGHGQGRICPEIFGISGQDFCKRPEIPRNIRVMQNYCAQICIQSLLQTDMILHLLESDHGNQHLCWATPKQNKSPMQDFIRPMHSGPSAELEASISLAIHEHRLLPGTKLGEDELGDIYGVSRTVVRTALQALSHSQLVDLKRNRGAYVAQPTVQEAREVFEARALLEPRTAFSAAERMTDDAFALLESHIAEEHAALADGAFGKALRLSGQFHIEISRIADQTTIAGFIERLVARSSLIIAIYWKRQSALCEKHAHHALVDAFQRRHGQDAEDLMKSHLLDILSALDLRDVAEPHVKLRDALQPPQD